MRLPMPRVEIVGILLLLALGAAIALAPYCSTGGDPPGSTIGGVIMIKGCAERLGIAYRSQPSWQDDPLVDRRR